MKARCSASPGPSFFICKVEIIGSCLLGLPSKFSKRICEKHSVQHLALSTKQVVQFSSVTQSDSLQPHGLQHTRPLCLSLIPRVYSNSCLSNQ